MSVLTSSESIDESSTENDSKLIESLILTADFDKELWRAVFYHRSCKDWSQGNVALSYLGKQYITVLSSYIVVANEKNLSDVNYTGLIKKFIREQIFAHLKKLGIKVFSQQPEVTGTDSFLVDITNQIIGASVKCNTVGWIWDVLKDKVVTIDSEIKKPCRQTLDEIAAKLKNTKPIYETTLISGPAHNQEFSVSCIYNKLSCIGNGASKKKATEDAARVMLQRLNIVTGSESSSNSLKFRSASYEPILRTKRKVLLVADIYKEFLIPKGVNYTTAVVPSRTNSDYGILPSSAKKLSSLGASLESFIIEYILANDKELMARSDIYQNFSRLSANIYKHIDDIRKSSLSNKVDSSKWSCLHNQSEVNKYYEKSFRSLLALSFLVAFQKRGVGEWLQNIKSTDWFVLLTKSCADINKQISALSDTAPLSAKILISLQEYGVSYQFIHEHNSAVSIKLTRVDVTSVSCIQPSKDSSLSVKEQKLSLLMHVESALNLFKWKNSYVTTYKTALPVSLFVNFLWEACVLNSERIEDKLSEIPESDLFNLYESYTVSNLLNTQRKREHLRAINKALLLIELRFKLGFDKTRLPLKHALVQPGIEQDFLNQHSLPVSTPEIEISNEESVSTLNQSISISTAVDTQLLSSESDKIKFRWPTTEAYVTDASIPEITWPKVGMLKAVGYKVGHLGEQKNKRRVILAQVYSEQLPFVDSHQYYEQWGTPESSSRLKKMAETIASLIRNAKRKAVDNTTAIGEWAEDLAWLKSQYYLQHKFKWDWPVLKDAQVVLKEKAVEKSYASSREFLISQYTNDANEFCCQACQTALPFKLDNGKYFFEEVNISSKLPKSPYSDLVLCPNHRSMFLHALSNKEQILDKFEAGFVEKLFITLAGVKVALFITKEHQAGIRAGIAKKGDNRDVVKEIKVNQVHIKKKRKKSKKRNMLVNKDLQSSTASSSIGCMHCGCKNGCYCR